MKKNFTLMALGLSLLALSSSSAFAQKERSDRPVRESPVRTETEMRQIDPPMRNAPEQVIKDTISGFKAAGPAGAVIRGLLSTGDKSRQ
ncbi:hypothetical protein [Armatimonas sp.]|uniref:hypothetical protein n=1 Tax=Armatimonas sp. TaxID=1872638 RepID=UPI0037532F5A